MQRSKMCLEAIFIIFMEWTSLRQNMIQRFMEYQWQNDYDKNHTWITAPMYFKLYFQFVKYLKNIITLIIITYVTGQVMTMNWVWPMYPQYWIHIYSVQ